MVRNRVFLNEVVGLPQNVAAQIAGQSVRFGKSSMLCIERLNGRAIAFKHSKLRSVEKDIFYLLKIK